MGELRTELRTEMGELRAGLVTEMGELRTGLVTEVRSEVADLKVWVQRWISGAAAANFIAVITAIAI